jgi:hypothetical protein
MRSNRSGTEIEKIMIEKNVIKRIVRGRTGIDRTARATEIEIEREIGTGTDQDLREIEIVIAIVQKIDILRKIGMIDIAANQRTDIGLTEIVGIGLTETVLAIGIEVALKIVHGIVPKKKNRPPDIGRGPKKIHRDIAHARKITIPAQKIIIPAQKVILRDRDPKIITIITLPPTITPPPDTAQKIGIAQKIGVILPNRSHQ